MAISVRYLPSSWARFWRPATVAVDLGTDSFRLAHAANRSLLEIPSRAILDPRGRVAAIGKRALQMEERVAENWRAVLPVEVGHLSHPHAARQLIRLLLRQLQRRRLWKPRLWLAAPVGMTPLERTVLGTFLRDLPVREFDYADGAVAQCIGAGLEPSALPGMMVVDVGAQRTGTTILSFGRPVFSEQEATGGHAWTSALRTAVEDAHRVRVPRLMVERWKREGGDGCLPAQNRLSGRVEPLDLSARFAEAAMENCTRRLLEHLTSVFTRCPPALRMDVQDRGLLLVGNGGRIPGLRDRLEAELGLPVLLAKDPGRCLVRGLAQMAMRRETPATNVAVTTEPEPAVDLLPMEA